MVKETRPAFARVDGGFIRIGSWGSLRDECKIIEAYKRADGPAGPFTVDYIPGGMWKVFHHDVFVRYADASQVKEMARHVALDRGAVFEEMALKTEAEQPDRGNHGPQPEVCKWIEEHDEVLVVYLGSDKNWPTGCWQISYDEGEQFVDEAQLLRIAKKLGMARTQTTQQRFDETVRRSTARTYDDDLDDAFGAGWGQATSTSLKDVLAIQKAARTSGRPYDDLDEAFGAGDDLSEAFG